MSARRNFKRLIVFSVLVAVIFLPIWLMMQLLGLQISCSEGPMRLSMSSNSAAALPQKRQNQSSLGTSNKFQLDEKFRVKNGGVVSYSDNFREAMLDLVNRKVEANDPELLRLVRELLDPPSTSPMLKLSHLVKKTPQADEIVKILKSKKNGFFIECGALDGERSSNTLYLEKVLGWTGLLVEVDPYFYTQLLGKARRSWSLNACLSLSHRPAFMKFEGSSLGSGRVDKIGSTNKTTPTVPCFPLETVLLAINQTRVDYFSLDVEGAELDVLRTIPFDHLTIDTLSVEYNHLTEGKKILLDFMQKKGYRMVKDIDFDDPAATLFVKDFIFVKN